MPLEDPPTLRQISSNLVPSSSSRKEGFSLSTTAKTCQWQLLSLWWVAGLEASCASADGIANTLRVGNPSLQGSPGGLCSPTAPLPGDGGMGPAVQRSTDRGHSNSCCSLPTPRARGTEDGSCGSSPTPGLAFCPNRIFCHIKQCHPSSPTLPQATRSSEEPGGQIVTKLFPARGVVGFCSALQLPSPKVTDLLQRAIAQGLQNRL